MGLQSLIFILTLTTIFTIGVVESETYNVLLPNGEVEKNLDLADLQTVLQEHYGDLYDDPELKEITKKITDDMLEEATKKGENLSQAEKEKLLGETIMGIARSTLEACRDFLYQKTGKHIIEIVD